MNIVPMTPLTDIHVCQNVGFDNTYEDSVIFNPDAKSGLIEQYNYFNSKTVKRFTKCTPCKLYNAIVLPVTADDIIGCDYIFFKNKNFSNKYIYAFITNIQFQNPGSTIVSYEVDPVQTFMYDIQFKDSFIERETVANDAIGKHIIEEGIETGPYVTYEQTRIDKLIGQSVVVGSTMNDDRALTPANPEYQGGVFTGFTLLDYKIPEEIPQLKTFIDNVVEKGKQDGIVAMLQMPTEFAQKINEQTAPHFIYQTFTKNYGNIDGYVPRNNKLFCYPYNFVNVSNNNGNDASYAYELFNKADFTFEVWASRSLSPELILIPRDYKINETGALNYEEKISLSGFPVCGWVSDAFKAYLAQNAIPTLLNAAGSVAQGTAAGAAVGGPAGAIVGGVGSAVGQVLGAVTNGYSEYIKPLQAHGTSNPSANYAAGIMNYTVMKKGITYDFAKRIDNFFTAYGYKVNRIGQPDLYSRSRFNYIKTINLGLRGNLPPEDSAKIKDIFNNGIRLWHDHVNIGSYAAANNIV